MTMSEDPAAQVSVLLTDWANGDGKALGEVVSIVYNELRRLARYHLQSERPDHTLQSTALVNEAFMRLLGSRPVELQGRAHFVAVASRLMRQILVDYARNRRASKRDGGARVELAELANLPMGSDTQLLALEDAVQALSQIDERQAQVVEMKFFGGLTTEEVSRALGVSLTTVERDWSVARLWLRRQMDGTRAQ
jgi:RNA polymerase sigma factor (TIGR02999 family)